MRQLAITKGVIGYSLRAEPLRKRYWTVSVWKDQGAINRYVQTSPHATVMNSMKGAMGSTALVSWTVDGADLPISWADALKHLQP